MTENLENGEWNCLVPFDDPSESFVNGFEAGMIWQRIESGEIEIQATIRIENQEVISKMARRRKYNAEIEDANVDGWLSVALTKQVNHLSVVK